MTDERQPVRVFLDMIERTRDARIVEISSEAERRSAEIVRAARAEARADARRAAMEARLRAERAIADARAEQRTLSRQWTQEAHRVALVEGRRELREVLHARWQSPTTRAAWIDALVADALGVLPRARCTVEHPTDLVPAELARAAEQLERRGGVAPSLVPLTDGAIGLRLTAGSVVIDGTVDGLLARSTEVEGQLLAEVDASSGEP